MADRPARLTLPVVGGTGATTMSAALSRCATSETVRSASRTSISTWHR